MSIPSYSTMLLPFLTFISDGQERSMRDLTEYLASHFSLSEEDRKDLLESGHQPRFDNRVGWTRTALKKAGLLETPRMSHVLITQRGRELLASKPLELTDKDLMRYPEYQEYKGFNRDHMPAEAQPIDGERSPQDRLEQAFIEINEALAEDVLSRVKACSPKFFEDLIVSLLVRMGYGGSLKDAGTAVGRSGDGGVDGVIKEDELGLDMIYLQAKRYTSNTVPAADVRNFVGALVGKRARKGVFITTSGFSSEALEVARSAEGKTLVMLDGKQLAKLMIKHEVGVTVTNSYKIGRMDEDFFEDVLT